MDTKTISAGRLADQINRGELKARDLAEKVLKEAKVINEELNIFCSIAGEEALEQASAVDKKVESGICLPLAGVPIIVKDDFMYKALPTTLGSPQFKRYYSPYNAAAVEKLVAAGAVIIGKANVDNMGIGSTTLDSPQGPTLNPKAQKRVAGSAGAAALAAGICPLALESDSGGSMRQGASYCGVYCLLPSAGLVSRHGLAVHSGSFCRVGLSAAYLEDLPVALKVISGYDARDAATASNRETNGKRERIDELSNIVVGYPEAMPDYVEDFQRNNYQQTLSKIKSLDVKQVEVKIINLPAALRAYQVIASAEASSTLLRYDGIRYGEAPGADDLDLLYSKTRRNAFMGEALNRSIFGTYFLSRDGYDLYYRTALKVWSLIRDELRSAFEQCDLLLLPVVRSLPPLVSGAPVLTELAENDLYTAPISMAGNPAVCLPAGDFDGLPAGVQLVGRQYEDAFMLSTAIKIVLGIESAPQGPGEGGN